MGSIFWLYTATHLRYSLHVSGYVQVCHVHPFDEHDPLLQIHLDWGVLLISESLKTRCYLQ